MRTGLVLVAVFTMVALISAISSIRLSRSFGTKLALKPKLWKSTVMPASTLVANKEIASHPNYKTVETFSVSEYGLEGALYKHRKSGAQVMSVTAPDDNKVFGITFRTPPSDSTGVAHVLEHSVLCGSRKFPVKEPFVELMKGSLQNFLNAFTYPDRTCYPVASTNTKDFYNLVHVYLDAVLHPRALNDPQVLQQEGWHYELDDPAAPLSVKGVVYNEMKGVYSSPDAILGRATQQALFPDNAYGVDSGGDPKCIPDLTYKQFKEFHGSYYHPSNSRIFFYGDDDPLERLNLLDEYLSEFSEIPVTSKVYPQKKFTQPLRAEVSFPLTPGMEPKHIVTTNWMLSEERLVPRDSLALAVLNHLLLGTSSSTLYKALIESNLGESVTGGGLSDELLQPTFSVGLKGVYPKDTAKVEELVQSVLQQVVTTGFDTDAIQAAMNTVEFHLREFNTGNFPKGLSVMLGMMAPWIYDGNPLDGVRFETPLQRLKDDLAAGNPVFEDLIRKYLLLNKHSVTMVAKPDAEMEANRVAEEEAWLAKAKASMSVDEVNQIIQETRSLRSAQEALDSPEARAMLPKLSIEDIDPTSKELPISVLSGAAAEQYDATVITHSLQTGGILYADLAFDYSQIDEQDLTLLPLFSRMLMEAGTKDLDLTALSRKIGSETGGIGVSYHNSVKHTSGVVSQPKDIVLYLLMRGKAVGSKVPILFDLFADILLTANLNNQQRAIEMLKESKVTKESAVMSSGHSYAATRLSSRYSFLGYLSELMGGITSVRAAGSLVDQVTNDWPSVFKRLERMRAAIIKKGKDGLIVNLTGDDELLENTLPTVKAFINTLPTSSLATTKTSVLDTWDEKSKLSPMRNEGFSIPSQVNYVVKGGQLLAPGTVVKGSYGVAARYLNTGYLWDQIRVLGGAYGGYCQFSSTTGRFVYVSYRDPNCVETLNVYDGTDTVLAESDISSEELLQAIIGAIGDLDRPASPDQKGYTSMLQHIAGETAEDRQRWRSEVLGTTTADFKEFAKHLAALRESGTVVVVGADQAMMQANEKLPKGSYIAIEPAL